MFSAAEIIELGQRWAQAELKGDTATLAELLTPDFTGVGPRGFVLGKDQWLQRYASGDLVNTSFSWQDVSVRGYGDAAVAIGVQDGEAAYNGHPASGKVRGTRHGGRPGSPSPPPPRPGPGGSPACTSPAPS